MRRRSVLGPKYRFAVAVTDQVLVVGRQQVQRRGRSGKIRPRAMYQPLPSPSRSVSNSSRIDPIAARTSDADKPDHQAKSDAVAGLWLRK